MRIPTFSRHSSSDPAEDERPTVVNGSTVAKPDDDTTTRFPTVGAANDRKADWADRKDFADRNDDFADRKAGWADARADQADAEADHTTAYRDQGRAAVAPAEHDRSFTAEQRPVREPEVTGPKPRASLLATLGLMFGVASALLVLSGPLLGYGIGLAVLALILSLSGIHATGRRHVAGKTDALIGMMLSLAAIVVGVLALTGSLSWMGTDMQPVDSLRNWLDTQFVDRF